MGMKRKFADGEHVTTHRGGWPYVVKGYDSKNKVYIVESLTHPTGVPVEFSTNMLQKYFPPNHIAKQVLLAIEREGLMELNLRKHMDTMEWHGDGIVTCNEYFMVEDNVGCGKKYAVSITVVDVSDK